MTMPDSLTPPEPLSKTVALTPPEPVKPIRRTDASGLVPLDDATMMKLEQKADAFVDSVAKAPVNTKAFMEKLDSIHNMGNDEIRASASMSNRMLERPVAAMNSGLFDEKSAVSRSLLDLRKTVEDLDPSVYDLASPRRILGIIPFGNKVRDYFMKYQSAQGQINAIINTLQKSQDELRMDNAVIEQEKVNLWETMQKLQQYIYLSGNIDAALEAKIDELQTTEPEKARVVREEMLFYVRQKEQDLLTQMAVSIQGYLALDMIRKNNLELIKGVDRATTTTVSALRTAVIVSQALANQKLVLDQINALNTTTGTLIQSTSEMLKQQSGDIHKQASSATVSLETLQTSFNNVYETIDMISTYKLEALDTMKQTITALSGEVDRANRYLDRTQQAQLAEVTQSMVIPDRDAAAIERLDQDDDLRL
jgi:uncharacterized protein YaaN involved in tellurite resistance